MAQYPIRKTRIERTVKNLLADGTLILYPDPNAARLIWQLAFEELSSQDLSALSGHFNACQGRLHAFTFIDPTENMLSNSANLLSGSWQIPSSVTLTANVADPNGGQGAFMLTNNAQSSQEIGQTLMVPSSYQYCFSLYTSSAQPSSVSVIRRGSTSQGVVPVPIGPQWMRVVSSGQLADSGTTLSAVISLAPGQQITLFGPQLEPQISPSRYRPTLQGGGVYANAHWGVDELPVSIDAPDLYSTAFSIEAAI